MGSDRSNPRQPLAPAHDSAHCCLVFLPPTTIGHTPNVHPGPLHIPSPRRWGLTGPSVKVNGKTEIAVKLVQRVKPEPLTDFGGLAVVCVVLVLDVVVHLVAVASEAADGDDVLVPEVQTLDGAVGHVGPD